MRVGTAFHPNECTLHAEVFCFSYFVGATSLTRNWNVGTKMECGTPGISAELSEGELEEDLSVQEDKGDGSYKMEPQNEKKKLQEKTSFEEDRREGLCTSEPQCKKKKLQESDNTEEDQGEGSNISELQCKRKKVRISASYQDNGQWETLSKRQIKKAKKNQHQVRKYSSVLSTPTQQSSTESSLLNTRQTEVLESLVKMDRGEEAQGLLCQKLLTSMFQQVVSHLVIGRPLPIFKIEGLEEMRQNHRVVVVWLSMISAEFFCSDPVHFPGLNTLKPCIRFDIQHPGSNTFAKLGLEAFMMGTDANKQATTPYTKQDSLVCTQPRWSYVFSPSDLKDHDFPNPLGGAADQDQLGRDVSEYVSLREWHNSDIQTLSEVNRADREVGNGKAETPMFAIDCEMVATEKGSELARISIVTEDFECVYDTYVKPDNPITDYRTKYSGICESVLEDVTTTLKDVQDKLGDVITPNSILIGHSLENDFHAMKFKHPFVIDTSCLFTPRATPLCKPGLRRLSKQLLDTDIQNSSKGHDSIEDATVCMKLVKLKLKEGKSCRVSFNEMPQSIFTDFMYEGHATAIADKDSVINLYAKESSYCVPVKTDDEAVVKSLEIIPANKFTFVQLHDMENHLRSNPQSNEEERQKVARRLDRLVMDLVKGCPSNTIVFIVCGSSDIRKVRALQQQEFTDFHQLKKQVMIARTGHVMGFLINT